MPYDVGAAWTEGECSTGIDVGGVQELQYTYEIGTVSLETQRRKKKGQSLTFQQNQLM